MIIDELSPQAVVHEGGRIVASVERTAFVYARDGRTTRLEVEPLDTYYVRLPERPAWDDGSPLSADEAQQLLADFTDTFAHWGIPCEFVYPGDPRILRTLDQLTDHIRSQAVGRG